VIPSSRRLESSPHCVRIVPSNHVLSAHQQPSSKQPALAAATIPTLKTALGCCDWHDLSPRGRWDCHEHADMQICRDNHEISRPHPHLHAAKDEDLSLKDKPSHVLRWFGNFRTTKHSAARHFQPGLQPRDPSNLRNIQDWIPKYPLHRGGGTSAVKSTPNKGSRPSPRPPDGRPPARDAFRDLGSPAPTLTLSPS